MLIPKNRTNVVVDAIAVALNNENWTGEEEELLKQISDRASLCLHGDGNFLEIEVRYDYAIPKTP